ncbi:MAG: hypothetical protein KZQ65_03345 [Candidatus Thiodiazotropha sp. (ex Gloverina cf. vestifex)]|nr:hypothetical protein [Candidatus Thiodiazotropha sp. (ex Gloverina cf. vestifex)]
MTSLHFMVGSVLSPLNGTKLSLRHNIDSGHGKGLAQVSLSRIKKLIHRQYSLLSRFPIGEEIPSLGCVRLLVLLWGHLQDSMLTGDYIPRLVLHMPYLKWQVIQGMLSIGFAP